MLRKHAKFVAVFINVLFAGLLTAPLQVKGVATTLHREREGRRWSRERRLRAAMELKKVEKRLCFLLIRRVLRGGCYGVWWTG